PTVMAVLMALGTTDPRAVRELNPAVPEPLAELIHQLLAKDPDARPASAAEVAKRLRSAADGTAPAVSKPSLAVNPTVVTAVSDESPFAELDATEAEPAPKKPSPAVAAPARTKPGRPWPLIAAGFA